MELFDSKISVLNDNSKPSDFINLQNKFPEYDSSYVFNASASSRRKFILKAYEMCKEYLDEDFCKEIRKPGKFIDRLWELQICLVLLLNNYKIIKRCSGNNFARPDFCVAGKDGSKIWIEAVCVGPDKNRYISDKPDLEPGVVYSKTRNIMDSLKKTTPRLTSSVREKYFFKLPKYIKNPEFDKEKDKFIVALNTHKIDHEMTGYMPEELMLYGMGLQYVKQTGESERYFHWCIETEKEKNKSTLIDVALFHREEYKPLSAVFASNQWFDFSSYVSEVLGKSIQIYFNHRALRPLGHDEFSFGIKKYMACDDEFCRLLEK